MFWFVFILSLYFEFYNWRTVSWHSACLVITNSMPPLLSFSFERCRGKGQASRCRQAFTFATWLRSGRINSLCRAVSLRVGFIFPTMEPSKQEQSVPGKWVFGFRRHWCNHRETVFELDVVRLCLLNGFLKWLWLEAFNWMQPWVLFFYGRSVWFKCRYNMSMTECMLLIFWNWKISKGSTHCAGN